MNFSDFDIVVSTTDTPESASRRERITGFFADAGITEYAFDIEPLCTVSPFPNMKCGHYGCDQHFAKILNNAAKEGKGLIYFEDDAVKHVQSDTF